MKLTKNEKATLKLLLDNARISDTEIAAKLKISSQAVGKIRRKLETNLITSYTPNLDFSKLGIQTIALAIAKITREGLQNGEQNTEAILKQNPHILNMYRVSRTTPTYILVYGFCDLTHLENFFYSKTLREEMHNFIDIQELFTFSHNGVLKNNPQQLFQKVIENLGKGSMYQAMSMNVTGM